jgi:hypothetical protein
MEAEEVKQLDDITQEFEQPPEEMTDVQIDNISINAPHIDTSAPPSPTAAASPQRRRSTR